MLMLTIANPKEKPTLETKLQKPDLILETFYGTFVAK